MIDYSIAGLIVGIIIFIYQMIDSRKAEKRQQDFLQNHVRPLYNQINAIAEKNGIDDRLSISEDGLATRIRPISLNADISIGATIDKVLIRATATHNDNDKE